MDKVQRSIAKLAAAFLVNADESVVARLPVMPRNSYLPKEVRDKDPIIPDGTDLAIWLWEDAGRDGRLRYNGIAFQGAAQKPLWYHYFRDEASRQRMVDDTARSRRQVLDRKKQERDDRKNFQHGLEVGSIFYSSWGYDQTNVDFYEVIAIQGKQVVIRQVAKKAVRSGGGTDSVVPIPGKYIDSPMKKIPSKGYQGKPSIRLNSFSSASLWDGKPKSETSFGYGH